MTNDDERTQPRPALGRRPWFALLRRARNFLRFALAMGRRIPGGRGTADLLLIQDGTGRWRPVVRCATFDARWRGLRPAPFGVGALIEGRSVHGVGMAVPVSVVALDGDGEIIGLRRLAPGDRLVFRGATFVLELPVGWPVPHVGARLCVRPMLAGCPAG